MSPTEEDDPLKWERMYEQQSNEKKNTASLLMDPLPTGSTDVPSQQSASPIRVITFDLDDTIWKTGITIAAANDVLAKHFETTIKGFQQPKRVENIMSELFQADKARYAPNQKDQAKSPVLLTQLRKDAIAHLATEYNNYTIEGAQFLADSAFAIWKEARHDAISSHMADSVRDCLQIISKLPTPCSNQERIIIGAITDGNSDPFLVEQIAEYFAFCVNAEEVGVGKPSRKLYEYAVQKVMKQLSPELMDTLMAADSWSVGPWWVHVGDDFLKDIVPAKEMAMRSIWSRELVLHKMKPTPEPSLSKQSLSAIPPEKIMEDFVENVASQRVVRMEIGSEDYLTNSLQNEFADAIVDRFRDVGQLLTRWHNEGLASSHTNMDGELALLSTQDERTSVEDTVVVTGPKSSATYTQMADSKYCMFCGQSLPIKAIFCSSCGEKQQ
jgi:FMN phosphatase YigB (HAD superfamily)